MGVQLKPVCRQQLIKSNTMGANFIPLLLLSYMFQISHCNGGWGDVLPVLSERKGSRTSLPVPGIVQKHEDSENEDRERIGLIISPIEPDPSVAEKQLPSDEIISESESSIEEEPCCDNLVSNTVELVESSEKKPSYGENLVTVTDLENQDEKCIKKIMMVEKIEYETEIECDHSYEKMCYKSLVTVYNPHQEEECDEDYIKDCFIDYEKAATNATTKVCTKKLEKICKEDQEDEDIGYGRQLRTDQDIICTTYYQSECVTRDEEHQVSEDVPECKTIEEKNCSDDSQGTCSTYTRQVCEVKTQQVSRFTPVTACEKNPVELCGPKQCTFKETDEEECHEKSVTVIHEKPGETCEIQPTKVCKTVTKLSPVLKEVEKCSDVPKEICSKKRGKPKKVKVPTLKKWCYNQTEEVPSGYGRSFS